MAFSPLNDEDLARVLLTRVAGLDPSDPQERDTPRRFVEALKQMTTPLQFDFTTFTAEVDQMVTVTDIRFASLCRHHVFPYYGVAHIGYIPNKVIAGLSKFPRLVTQCSASLSTQEELTEQIANVIEGQLDPLGVAVVLQAEHTCMGIRGAKALGSKTRTTVMRGVFNDHSRTAKMEFMEAIR